MSLPMVNTYKFCKKEILIQPSGEPQEQHLGDVRPQKVWATQNFIKTKMIGLYSGAFLRKMQKS